MFEGETYNNTGIYGATSTTVYRYSYYFQEWFPLEMIGLPNISGNINIIDIAVADTGTGYTSGIYIIADTAVYHTSIIKRNNFDTCKSTSGNCSIVEMSSSMKLKFSWPKAFDIFCSFKSL